MPSVRATPLTLLLCVALFLPVLADAQDLELRVMTYNIYWGGHDHGSVQGRDREWLGVIENHNPDLILLQECNGWHESEENYIAIYVDSLNQSFPEYPPYEGYVGFAWTGFHVTVISRLPIISFETFHEVPVGPEIVEIHHVFIHAILDAWGTPAHAIGVHFKPGQNREDRQREACALLEILDGLPVGETVWIGGDFNSYSPIDCEPGSPTPPDYAHGALPPEIKGWEPVGYLLDRGYEDSFRTQHPLELGYTQETEGMHPGGLGPVQRVDFVLRSPNSAWELYSSEVITDSLGHIGSDHYAVFSTYRRPSPAAVDVGESAQGRCHLWALPNP
ncbi:MAG: endonuclease/exonuclease/phosphatase family protein, partial [Candidatus Eisenbacteria sp.]|nr:endonuclease/exonuclease/phosphatase family protein [Candidatus Eisenbacteria bacterium]